MKEFVHSIKESVLNFNTWSRLIIDVNEIKVVLKYKDIRSVIKWCNHHNVFVLNQGKTQAVNHIEFILAFYRPFMEHLKQNQENWKERFLDYILGNMTNLIDGAEKPRIEQSSYKPKSALEKAFLQKMKTL